MQTDNHALCSMAGICYEPSYRAPVRKGRLISTAGWTYIAGALVVVAVIVMIVVAVAFL